MKIGALRHRIQIQSLSLASDGQGGSTETWATVATVWADVQPVSASERVYGQKLEYQRSHKVIIRYLADLTIGVSNTHRFLFDSRTFQIKGVYKMDEKKFWLKIDAMENQGT